MTVAFLESQQLATARKRVSHKKGQRTKNLARNATASHSFAPVRKATLPNPPGVKPSRGKDPPEYPFYIFKSSSQEAVESESEDMFITLKTPCFEPLFDESISTGSSPLLGPVASPDNRPSKREGLSRSQTTKGQKQVTSFFSSQKRVKK